MCVYSFIILVSCYFGRVGSVGISLAGRVIYILCVCVSAVWSAGPVQFLFRHSVGADGGTVQTFSFPRLCCSGYGTVEMVRGGWSVFLFAIFSLLSVLLAVGCLW